MKKITVYTNDQAIISALSELNNIEININTPCNNSDLYITDIECTNCITNLMHPLITIISDNITETPLECEYIIQRPFDKKRFLDTVKLFIPEKNEPNSEHSIISDRIISLFDSIGMDNRRKGYKYLVELTYLYIKASGNCLLKELFVHIAIDNSTTAAAVERSIRTAIEHTWRYGNITRIDELFGNSIDPEKGKPSNAEFVSMIAEQYKLIYRFSKR